MVPYHHFFFWKEATKNILRICKIAKWLRQLCQTNQVRSLKMKVLGVAGMMTYVSSETSDWIYNFQLADAACV